MDERLAGLRVLLTTDAVGGVWTYSLDLARELGRNGIETVLAVLGPPPVKPHARRHWTLPHLELVTTGLPLDWMAAGPERCWTRRAPGASWRASSAARWCSCIRPHSPRRAPSMCR